MLVFFATSKYGKRAKNTATYHEVEKKEFALENIHVIVCESGNVNIKPDDRDYIKIAYYEMQGETENIARDADAIYRVSNDTLYCHNDGIHASVDIYCQKVSSLIAKNKSEISLRDVNFDRLTAEIDHARLNIRDNGDIKRGAVSISANEAHIDFYGLSVDTLHIQANKSNISLYGQLQIHLVSAKLENETTLSNHYGRGTNKIEIEKDSTSRCNMYN
jgi:hypothetical protein